TEARRDLRIVPAVILNQLSLSVEERFQIRIQRIEHATLRCFRALHVAVELKVSKAPVGIFEYDISKEVEPDAQRTRTAHGGPSQFAAGREPGKEQAVRARVSPCGVNPAGGLH